MPEGSQRKPLPPLIEQWLQELHNPSTKLWVRENLYDTLHNIRSEIDKNLKIFDQANKRRVKEKQ